MATTSSDNNHNSRLYTYTLITRTNVITHQNLDLIIDISIQVFIQNIYKSIVSFATGGDDMLIWRVAKSTLNNQSRTADNGPSSRLGFGRLAEAPHRKNWDMDEV
jgi:hypothetical protein